MMIDSLFGQTLKIGNGLSFSHINGKPVSILNENISNYSVFAGIEYLKTNLFYFSSEIGYAEIGGKETNALSNVPNSNLYDSWTFLNLNTTIRLKGNYKTSEGYLGIGPELNFLLDKRNFRDSIYNGYNVKNTNLGLKAEIGIDERIGNFKIGLNGSYDINLSPFASSPFLKLHYNAINIFLVLGYTFN